MLGFSPIGSTPIAALPPDAITAVLAWLEGSETFAATGTVSAPASVTASLAWTEGSETFSASGLVSAPASVSASIDWTEGSETFAAAGSVAAPGVSAAIGWTEGAEAWSVAVSVTPAGSTVYARAPSGDGYHVRHNESQDRPAAVSDRNRMRAIQRNQR